MYAQLTTATTSAASTATPEEAALGVGVILALVAAGLFITFIPALIALVRGHRSWLAISAVCVFFGWTVLGWIVALIWSLADTGRR